MKRIVLLLVGTALLAGCSTVPQVVEPRMTWSDLERSARQALAEISEAVQHRLRLGMSMEQVFAQTDLRPVRCSRSVGSFGVHEQWSYDLLGLYVYFDNGKLESWQSLQ